MSEPVAPDLLVTVDDFAVRLGVASGSLSTADRLRAEAAIRDASALVRAEARQVWAPPDVTPEAVHTVVFMAARRAYTNPDGYRSQSAGPFSVQPSVVGVYLTEQEIGIVRRYRPTSSGSSGLWTLATTRGDPCTTGFVDDQYGTEPIPYYALGPEL